MGDNHLPESLYGPCGWLRYHELPHKVTKSQRTRYSTASFRKLVSANMGKIRCLSFSVCREFGFIAIQMRDKNPTLIRRFCVPPKCAHPTVRNDNVPPKWDGSPTGCHNPTGRYFVLWTLELLHRYPVPSSAWRQARDWKGDRERRRRVCVFITAGPITKLFAGGEEEESGGHHDGCLVMGPHCILPRPIWAVKIVVNKSVPIEKLRKHVVPFIFRLWKDERWIFQVAHHGPRNTPGCLYQSQVMPESI